MSINRESNAGFRKEHIELESITFLRLISMMMILLCHFAFTSSNIYALYSTQFFNIGVQLFYIISGFCFGIQDEIIKEKQWLLKRLKRIFIPFWIYLLFILVVHMIHGTFENPINWLLTFIGVHGTWATVGGGRADMVYYSSAVLLYSHSVNLPYGKG